MAIIDTVRALLAKAEATPYPEEAQAFFAKATAMMAKHAIEEAAIYGIQDTEAEGRTLRFEAPYALGKMLIANSFARAFNVRLLRTSKGKIQGAAIFGTPSNLDAYEATLNSVLIHAAVELNKARVPGGENARSFRAAFLQGYAYTIGQVIEAAVVHSRSDALKDMTADDATRASLVLVSDIEKANAAVKEAYSTVSHTSVKGANSRSGRTRGGAAADRYTVSRSSLSGRRELGSA